MKGQESQGGEVDIPTPCFA